MTVFIETPRFPENISYGSSGGPGFKTHVFEGSSGVEQRTQAWSRMRARWDVSYGIREKSDMDLVRKFFYEARGKALGFRFKDWSDFELVAEAIGTGDGTKTTFDVIKTYGTANPYIRRIYKLVTGTVSVTVNAVPVTIGGGSSDVAVNYNTGVLTFGASAVPSNGHVVKVDAEFDVPVRFDTDQLQAAHDGWLTESWASIPLVELREEDLT